MRAKIKKYRNVLSKDLFSCASSTYFDGLYEWIIVLFWIAYILRVTFLDNQFPWVQYLYISLSKKYERHQWRVLTPTSCHLEVPCTTTWWGMFNMPFHQSNGSKGVKERFEQNLIVTIKCLSMSWGMRICFVEVIDLKDISNLTRYINLLRLCPDS